MAFNPKNNEEKMLKVLNAWKTLAPTAEFAGLKLADFEAQVAKSSEPRQRLIELKDEMMQEQARRDTEDVTTMSRIECVVAGVVADPAFGSDSALYEAMGYIRKSDRRSGLTRKSSPAARAKS